MAKCAIRDTRDNSLQAIGTSGKWPDGKFFMGAVPGVSNGPYIIEAVVKANVGIGSHSRSLGLSWNGTVVVETIEFYTPAPILATAERVKTEAQQRIVALLGARDFNDCIVKELNAAMRAIQLNNILAEGGVLTQAQTTEANALKALAANIEAIRTASNTIEVDVGTLTEDQLKVDVRWPNV